MKTKHNIRAVVIENDNSHITLINNFLAINNIESFTYNNDSHLHDILQNLQNNNYASKEVLILKKFKGRFFQKCPGSPNMICCNYYVCNTCFNCLYDCSYCFLNQYLNSFGIIQFSNLDEFYSIFEKELVSRNNCEHILRVGPGEFTDTLMFDEITGISTKLIEISSHYDNVMLELKTKSNNIHHILDIEKKGNAVISWTLSPERNIALYENGTASLSQRIEAARLASQAGYKIAVHFDPIIIYKGWEDDYDTILNKLFSNIDLSNLVWISMGGFRYASGFKEILRLKFPEEEMTTEEMFPGIDGKYRYLKNKRIEIYRTILQRIKRKTDTPFVYLCMESSDVWQSVFGLTYTTSEELERDFSDHLKKHIFFNKM